MRIAIAGAGYVGLSLAALLSRRNEVVLVDVDCGKVAAINAGTSPAPDTDVGSFLKERGIGLRATLDADAAYSSADIVIVAVSTDYDDRKGMLDTSRVAQVAGCVNAANPSAVVAVKSTLPVGATDDLSRRYPKLRLLYSPEFLREGRAMHDCLHPSRIVVGVPEGSGQAPGLNKEAESFAGLLAGCAEAGGGARALDIPTLVMPAAEAEAVKLFSNAYLAMRVAYFNELDAFCDAGGMDASLVVRGVCADSRIGDFYNNPSFGFGGGCLPKDLRQLGNSFGEVPHSLIRAIAESNASRTESVVDAVASRVQILAGTACPVVGMYRLAMKSGVDDVRSSSMRRVAEGLWARGLRVIVYEPASCAMGQNEFEAVRDLRAFKDESDLIVANRWADELLDVSSKVYTRDLYGRD